MLVAHSEGGVARVLEPQGLSWRAVVKARAPNEVDGGSTSGWGTKIPHAMWRGQKKGGGRNLKWFSEMSP